MTSVAPLVVAGSSLDTAMTMVFDFEAILSA